MSCSGDWDVTQVAGADVDPTGLTFTATDEDGDTSEVTDDVTWSPEKWAAEAGEQTATFTYVADDGGVVTCTKKATVTAAEATEETI